MRPLRRTFFEDKHCFVYCGDDRCDCQRSPYFAKTEEERRKMHEAWERMNEEMARRSMEELNERIKKQQRVEVKK
jgi:hypothetical protein